MCYDYINITLTRTRTRTRTNYNCQQHKAVTATRMHNLGGIAQHLVFKALDALPRLQRT